MGKDTKNMGRNTKDLDYQLVRMIGEGAFSRVYLAEGWDGQQYACKVSGEVKMLRREAKILGSLYHPLFPTYIGYEENGDVGKLFMEYIPGRSLEEMLRVRGKFSARQTMRIAGELAGGLRYLHERQPTILYRDLKPGNIMLCENGHIKVIDFGCACCQDAQGGVKVGTPGFAPPEQLASGGAAGVYSDVYGLGKTVQSILAGNGQCHDYHSMGWRRLREERRCHSRLERMIEAATCDDFRQRPQDMSEVLHILTGQRKMEQDIICEKNIWESRYKNPCSLP